MKQRLLLISLACSALVGSFTPIVTFAAETQSSSHLGSTSSQLENAGLSAIDANYYVKLDLLRSTLMNSRKVIKFPKGMKQWSDNKVLANPNKYRNSILKLDPAALVAGIMNDDRLHTQGLRDLQQLIKLDKENGTVKGSYTFSFPDGSSVSMKSSITKDPNSTNTLHTDTTNDSGPWGSNATMLNYQILGHGQIALNFSVTFTSGTQKEIITNSTGFDLSSSSAQINWTGGSSYCDGIDVFRNGNIVNQAPYPYASTTAISQNSWTQAYSAQPIKVTGTVSYTMSPGISFTWNSGNTYNIAAIQELAGDGTLDQFGANYS